jgi:hypothetical protein
MLPALLVLDGNHHLSSAFLNAFLFNSTAAVGLIAVLNKMQSQSAFLRRHLLLIRPFEVSKRHT